MNHFHLELMGGDSWIWEGSHNLKRERLTFVSQYSCVKLSSKPCITWCVPETERIYKPRKQFFVFTAVQGVFVVVALHRYYLELGSDCFLDSLGPGVRCPAHPVEETTSNIFFCKAWLIKFMLGCWNNSAWNGKVYQRTLASCSEYSNFWLLIFGSVEILYWKLPAKKMSFCGWLRNNEKFFFKLLKQARGSVGP